MDSSMEATCSVRKIVRHRSFNLLSIFNCTLVVLINFSFYSGRRRVGMGSAEFHAPAPGELLNAAAASAEHIKNHGHLPVGRSSVVQRLAKSQALNEASVPPAIAAELASLRDMLKESQQRCARIRRLVHLSAKQTCFTL